MLVSYFLTIFPYNSEDTEVTNTDLSCSNTSLFFARKVEYMLKDCNKLCQIINAVRRNSKVGRPPLKTVHLHT